MATAGFASSANFGNFGSSASAGANSIYVIKVTLINAATVTAVLINVGTGASVQFKAVIYDGSHSALLAAGSTVASVASGYNRLPLTANVSLAAGTYYVGYACNSALNVTIATLSGSVGGSTVARASAPPLTRLSVARVATIAFRLLWSSTARQRRHTAGVPITAPASHCRRQTPWEQFQLLGPVLCSLVSAPLSRNRFRVPADTCGDRALGGVVVVHVHRDRISLGEHGEYRRGDEYGQIYPVHKG